MFRRRWDAWRCKIGAWKRFVTYRAIAAKNSLEVSVIDVEQKHTTRRHDGCESWKRTERRRERETGTGCRSEKIEEESGRGIEVSKEANALMQDDDGFGVKVPMSTG